MKVTDSIDGGRIGEHADYLTLVLADGTKLDLCEPIPGILSINAGQDNIFVRPTAENSIKVFVKK